MVRRRLLKYTLLHSDSSWSHPLRTKVHSSKRNWDADVTVSEMFGAVRAGKGIVVGCKIVDRHALLRSPHFGLGNRGR